jgi:hypothetical protein
MLHVAVPYHVYSSFIGNERSDNINFLIFGMSKEFIFVSYFFIKN